MIEFNSLKTYGWIYHIDVLTEISKKKSIIQNKKKRWTLPISETLGPEWRTRAMNFIPRMEPFSFRNYCLHFVHQGITIHSMFLISRELRKFQTYQSIPCKNNILSHSNQKVNFGFLTFKFQTRFPSKEKLSGYLP